MGTTKTPRPHDPRPYWDSSKQCWPASQQCEHCDGTDSALVRKDYLRGFVCPPCDVVLDEMFADEP